jgi:uncharacterized protein (DUF58 family)
VNAVSDTSHEREVLRRVEMAVTRRLDGLLQGDYRGLIPAHGSELGEARSYQPGDDVRRIDWNVTARTNTIQVRETIADRELETRVLVDLSASLDFGTADRSKRDLSLAAAAAIGFVTARLGNRFGLAFTGADRLVEVPARGGRSHLYAALRRLQAAPIADGVPSIGLDDAIHRMATTFRRRGLAVVISDFLAPQGWEDRLRRLSVKHDVLAIEVIDPRELELPAVGVLELIDPETGQMIEVQTSDPALRDRFATAAADQRARHARLIRGAGAEHLVLRTDRDWLMDLVAYTARRRRLLTGAGQ